MYRPRNPGASPLFQLFETHYEVVKSVWEERFERQYGFWQGRWDRAVAAVSSESPARACPSCAKSRTRSRGAAAPPERAGLSQAAPSLHPDETHRCADCCSLTVAFAFASAPQRAATLRQGASMQGKPLCAAASPSSDLTTPPQGERLLFPNGSARSVPPRDAHRNLPLVV